MTSHKHCNVAYTVVKLDNGEFRAAYRSSNGSVVAVTNKLRRVAVACVKGHIEEETE